MVAGLMKQTVWVAGLATGLVLAPVSGAEEEFAMRESAAKHASQVLLQRLGEQLKNELSEGSVQEAINVCRDLAPQISGELSRQHGWRITRVGTRVRNPMLGSPDAWEQSVLELFQQRMSRGENIADIAYSEVVHEPNGDYFRFMKAIGTQTLCLNCHGKTEQIAEPVRIELKKNYPFDRAIDYTVGDLRGAVSIKQPMDIPVAKAIGQ